MMETATDIYARFDASSRKWSKEKEYNLIFLKSHQNYANDLLHARGHVFLNEVYDLLGIERTREGQITGWLLDGTRKTFIDFGDLTVSEDGSITLHFQVDGVIYDKI